MKPTKRERFDALWHLMETEEVCPGAVSRVIGCSERYARMQLRRKRRRILQRLERRA